MIKNASLRQLKVFEAVARNLSYTRAAEEVYHTGLFIELKPYQSHIFEY